MKDLVQHLQTVPWRHVCLPSTCRHFCSWKINSSRCYRDTGTPLGPMDMLPTANPVLRVGSITKECDSSWLLCELSVWVVLEGLFSTDIIYISTAHIFLSWSFLLESDLALSNICGEPGTLVYLFCSIKPFPRMWLIYFMVQNILI